jgi:hypothetical protein
MAVVSNGTTLIDNGALDAGVSTGDLILLSTQTASASATIDFTSGIDSTYDSYVFKFINIHPATGHTDFSFQVDTGTNTNYNQTMTTTYFRAYHIEADTGSGLGYQGGSDQAQGTGFQAIARPVSNENDGSASGHLQIFNPSSSVFVKHFIARVNNSEYYSVTPYSATNDCYVAGYINNTTAITRVRFKMSSGNIDDGIIKMYGVS